MDNVTTPTPRRTLADIAAATAEYGTERVWGALLLRREYVIGQAGARRTGTLKHVVRLERVAERLGPMRPGTVKVGDVFSSYAICGTRSNGQRTSGAIYPGLDTDAVTCTKCGGGR